MEEEGKEEAPEGFKIDDTTAMSRRSGKGGKIMSRETVCNVLNGGYDLLD